MAEAISILEHLPLTDDFRKKIRKKEYSSSTLVSIETAKLLKDIIQYSIDNKLVTYHEDLLNLIKHLGRSFIAMDQLQFSIGNIVKRILFIIREEVDKLTSFRENNLDSQSNLKKLSNVTSLNLLTDYKNIKMMTRKDSKVEEEQEKKVSVSNIEKITPEMKNNILLNIEDLISELDLTTELINAKTNKHINENEVILTANHSDQLEDFFIECSKKKKFKVYIAESSPSLNGFIQAKNLIKKGIDTTIIEDTEIYSIIPKITKVIIGTRAIVANGGLISYNGVYNICLFANMFNIPVIVVGGSFKLTPLYIFGHDTYNDFLSPDVIFGKDINFQGDISNIRFNTPGYDYVPPELITIYVTNYGSQNPANIYRLFMEFYSQEDYFL
jgi:translation initiation factor eIF-2B subunit beta